MLYIDKWGHWIGTHIRFKEYPLAKKITTSWHVENYGNFTFLGTVKWHSPWRQYSFYPESNTIFEQVCLREIAQFIEERTKEHKTKQVKMIYSPGLQGASNHAMKELKPLFDALKTYKGE